MQGAYEQTDQDTHKSGHPGASSGPRVLLLEHEVHLRKVASLSLQQVGMNVLSAASADEAAALLREHLFQLVIVAVDREDESLNALLEAIRPSNMRQSVPVIVVTGERIRTEWRNRHKPAKTIYKPYDIRHLCRTAQALIKSGGRAGNQ